MTGRGRGRGRGAGRGRGGRGRSRGGGRGRNFARPARAPGAADDNNEDDIVVSPDENLDISGDVRQFFIGTANFDHHYNAQNANMNRYLAGMFVLNKNGVDISQSKKLTCYNKIALA